MSEPAPAPQDPFSADSATDRAIARGERLRGAFEAITEFGMERLRDVDATPYESGATPDPVKAYATASRVVRVSLIFEARIDGALRDLIAGPASATPKDNPRVERWLRLLEEAGEIGMRLLTAHEAARREVDEDGKPRDTSEGFATLTRAIRLTLMLEARTDPELRVLKAGVVSVAPKPEAPKAEVDPYADERPLIIVDRQRIEDVSNRVWEAIDYEAESEEEWERLWDALWDRVEDDNEWLSADRPIRQSIEKLCKDIGLSPDWSRWEGERWIDDGKPTRWELREDEKYGLTREQILAQAAEPLPDHMRAAQPVYVPESEFKSMLRDRVSEAIDTYAVSEEHFVNLFEALDERLRHDEPYMNGERAPLRDAVFRLCEELRLMPDQSRWRDGAWIDDGARCRAAAPPPHNLE